MKFDIITAPLHLEVYGFSATAVNKDYSGTAFKLMDKMWNAVKTNKLENKGLNIWVFEPGERVFAGVELVDAPPATSMLEKKIISLNKYVYHKHIGPYSLIKQAGQNMQASAIADGYEPILPYLEIYGHWTQDESKLETELIMCLK